jgi:WD40 repeat protein
MSPEQARAQPLDPRSDVFSFGVVLYELLAGKHPFRRETGVGTLTAIVEETPPSLESLDRGVSPAASGIVRRCLEKAREDRYPSGHEVAMVLEAVLAAPSEAVSLLEVEERSPYPGLSSFTEKDAGFFFGREREVEELWGRIRNRKLLGVIGPSGTGKTSFVRAGVVASRSEGWAAIVCGPGAAPERNLADALAPEMAGDPEAVRELLRFDDPQVAVSTLARWRRGRGEALLVVDQFEELFTLNPPETQERFATLLARLTSEADIHVLLSLRDDFLIRCCEQEPLAPVLEGLTALLALKPEDLRRAIEEPAKKRGYRFEDETLVEEMVQAVEGARAALPLLAFAVSRLWEKRDRERKLLTRAAYEEIGGVAGALAQHAEATMDRIGSERQGLVREVFRNLVTAQGTRAVIDREELLSAFADQEAAGEVLGQLIDARLLTSYEVEGEEDEPSHHRIEVVHESLLRAWPRLVRWQAQDEEGALLRDQLKQAAHLWEEKGRTPDLLWSGTAFREFELWRERYPGQLTALEEDFSHSMVERARRRRRLRRGAVAAVIVILAGVAGAIAVSRQQAARARDDARAEARRAESSKLVTLGNVALGEERTRALAYAIASLERADTLEGRKLALRALWAGPPATVLEQGVACPLGLAFAPDGRHLAVGYGSEARGRVRVFPRSGGPPAHLSGFEGRGRVWHLAFSPDGRHLVGSANLPEVRVWETEGWQTERVLQVPGVPEAVGFFEPGSETVLTVSLPGIGAAKLRSQRYRCRVHRWPLSGGPPRLLGGVSATEYPGPLPDLSLGVMPVGRGSSVELHRIETLGTEPGRVIAQYPEAHGISSLPAFDPSNDRMALSDSSGLLYLWPLDGDGRRPERRIEAPQDVFWTAFGPNGSLLAQAAGDQAGWLWDLRGPSGAEPLRFDREGWTMHQLAFSPDGRWLATSGWGYGIAVWPLTDRYCRILSGHEGGVEKLEFSPDGSRLFTQGVSDGKVLSWDLSGGAGVDPDVVFQTSPGPGLGLSVDPRGRFVVCSVGPRVWKVPLSGAEPSLLEGFPFPSAAVDPAGRLVASPATSPNRKIVVVLDLETGERWELEGPGEGHVSGWSFDPQGRLLVARGGVLSRWDATTGQSETLLDGGDALVSGTGVVTLGDSVVKSIGDGRRLYLGNPSGRDSSILDLETGSRTPLPPRPRGWVTIDATGSILVSGPPDGEIRVGPIFGEEPHLLLGHGPAYTVSRVSPDGRWIASLGHKSKVVRLWPMPDLSQRPFHTLPYDELMPRLKALTNLRAVPDEESHTGYTIRPDFNAYRGWETVPEW